jgi:hypothetical protein
MEISAGVTSVDSLRQAAKNASAAVTNPLNNSTAQRQVTRQAELAQQQNQQQIQQQLSAPPVAEPARDSIRVSSSIGKSASSGMLTRDEAVAIYQQIAEML